MALVWRWVRKLIIGRIWCIKHTMSKIHNYVSFSLQMIHFSLLWNKWLKIKNSRLFSNKKMNNSWEKSFARARLFAEKMCSRSVKPFLLLNIVISGLILVATWVWFIFFDEIFNNYYVWIVHFCKQLKIGSNRIPPKFI